MSVEAHKTLARRFLEALVTRNLETMDEVMAAAFVSHDSLFSGQEPDREGVRWAIAQSCPAPSPTSAYASKTRWPGATR